MKKICIINFNVYCLFEPTSLAPMGGAELDMYSLAKGLSGANEVSVITGDWGQNAIEFFDGIRVMKSFRLGSRGPIQFLKSIILFWKNLNQSDADVYISSGAGPEVGVIAFFCRLNKKNFIYRTAHLIDCNGSYIQAHGFSGLMYEYGLRNASRIVTSVRQHKDILIDQYPSFLGKIHHINLGIYTHNVLSDKSYVLWVARCEKWKKPEIYLEIASMLDKVPFVMICPKQNNHTTYFDEIKRKAESLSNMTFIDFVPFKDIQPYFDKAKVFINTSDFEGFTYTLIQSGLARTPVVYLNVNPDEVITKHNIGYVAGGDVKKLIEQMKNVLEDENNWNKKSENSFRYVKENHDINIVAEQWKKLLQNL